VIKGQFFGKIGTKLVNFGGKIPHFLEKVHGKGMIFHGNSLHCKGPILEAKFWAERMVVFRSSAPPGDKKQEQVVSKYNIFLVFLNKCFKN